MQYLRKTGLALLVSLTAISTLIAGMPHWVCLCPNGQVKPFCLSSPSKTAKCCCNGSCCGSEAGTEKTCQSGSSGPKAEGGCCSAQHEDDETGAAPGAGFTAQRNCCTKTLVLSETQLFSEAKVVSSSGVDFLKLATPEAGISHFLSVPEAPNTPWEVFRVPPPTDLITVLQRLTI
jgi:hypothetical protein